MIRDLIRLLDTKAVTYIRLLCCAMMMMVIAVSLFGIQAPSPKEIYDISVETRLTALQVKVENIIDTQKETDEKVWVIMLGILGLTGETGLRIVKGRNRKDGGL